MPDAWKVIDRELWRRRLNWAALGRSINASPQTMNNWRKLNKVPPSRYADIANFFGWTIEQVMGVAPAPNTPPERQAEPVEAAPEHSVEPVYTQRAHDIASVFDELKDPAVRQTAYTTVLAVLQMAKAGQRHPDDPEPG